MNISNLKIDYKLGYYFVLIRFKIFKSVFLGPYKNCTHKFIRNSPFKIYLSWVYPTFSTSEDLAARHILLGGGDYML